MVSEHDESTNNDLRDEELAAETATSTTNDGVVEEELASLTNKLMESYDQDAIECLKHLVVFLKQRVEEDDNKEPIYGVDVGTVVAQSMSVEPMNVDLQQEGACVLNYLALINGQCFPVNGISILCAAATNHPEHEGLREVVYAAIASGLTKMDATPEEVTIIVEYVSQTIKGSVKDPTKLSRNLKILSHLASKSQTIQSQLTDIVPVVCNVLKEKNTQTKKDACDALASLCVNHADNQLLIANLALSTLLDAMRWYTEDPNFQHHAFEVLANMCQNSSSKHKLLAKGGLDCILTAMQTHWQHVSLQATGCRAIANLFAGTSDDVKAKGTTCIKSALKAMRMHLMEPQIQLYGCCALRNLSQIQQETVSESGGIGTIVIAMRENKTFLPLQEQACAALYNLLSQGKADDALTLSAEGGIPVMLEVLKANPKVRRLQIQGIAALACLSDRKANNQEAIVAGKGLDIVLTALELHGGNPGIAKNCCDILENLTHTEDFQRAVVVKNGIKIILKAVRHHKDNEAVQHHGSSCIRNLCLNRDNLRPVAAEGGIVALLVAIQTHPSHVITQAYCCDALGRLAMMRQNQVIILAKRGIDTIMETMKNHPEYIPIQEKGAVFLINMSNLNEAKVWMKNFDAIPVLKKAEWELPRSSKVKPIVKELIKKLQN